MRSARCAEQALIQAKIYAANIFQLLHLHPLTLEDILTQDPREKLELFPKLGYYFISFRAIESQKTRERVRNLLSVDDDALRMTDEGVVGEVNVYLIIFREGICSVSYAACSPGFIAD